MKALWGKKEGNLGAGRGERGKNGLWGQNVGGGVKEMGLGLGGKGGEKKENKGERVMGEWGMCFGGRKGKTGGKRGKIGKRERA